MLILYFSWYNYKFISTQSNSLWFQFSLFFTFKMDEFNDLNSSISVFLLSIWAGGLGINLTAADTCNVYDSEWNPQMDLQAMDRCHSIRQTRLMHVYKLTTSHNVEGRIIKKALGKLKLEHVVITEGQFLQDRLKNSLTAPYCFFIGSRTTSFQRAAAL